MEVLRTAPPPSQRRQAVDGLAISHRLRIDAGHADPDLMANARAQGHLWVIDTGHDLMITEPRAVTAALLEVATN